MRAYTTVLSAVGVRRLLLANLISAAAIGGLPVAILLGLQTAYGSLGPAGSGAGLFAAGNAFGLIIQGRLLDRLPARAVIMIAAAGCATVLAAVLAALAMPVAAPPLPWVSGALGLAGLCLPAITTAVRAMLSRHPQLEPVRLSSYALLSVTFQAGMAIGPLLVSAMIIAVGTRLALIVPLLELVLAAALFTIGHDPRPPAPVRQRPAESDASARRGTWTFGLVALAALAVTGGVAGGLTTVGIPAATLAFGLPAAAGVYFTLLAVGELIGGIIYGSRPAGRLVRQLMIAQAAAVLVAAAVAMVIGLPILLGTLLLIGAFVSAPAGIATTTLLDRVVDRRRISSSYALLVCASLCGAALATGVGGFLADAYGPRLPFALAPVLLLAGLAVTAFAFRGGRGSGAGMA